MKFIPGLLLASLVSIFSIGCSSDSAVTNKLTAEEKNQLSVASFAGGCFWCVEADFEKLPGVKEAISGYSGGQLLNPTYEQVSSGKTGHTETVQVYYDPNQISYRALVEAYWRMIDPTDGDGSFVDRGKQYRPAIFYHDEMQREIVEVSKKALEASAVFDKKIVVEVVQFNKFFEAEEYHQNYYKKNPVRYGYYRNGSGRDQFLESKWSEQPAFDPYAFGGKPPKTYSKPEDALLKKNLTRLQYDVTQKDATEPPYKNEYWDEKREGIYVDIASGEPLFSSKDKYDSKTGWPSFTRPLVASHITQHNDYKLIVRRIELRSKYADSHLGHLFNDGPEPTGLRYCINSAALRFIPKEKIIEEGYGEFSSLFEE